MRTALIVVLFAAVVVGFFFDVLPGGKVLLTTNPALFEPWRNYASDDALHRKTYRTDSVLTYLPRRAELSRSIASGRMPLWDPYILTGEPFFADPQSRCVYPVSLLLTPFDAEKAMGYDVALHFLLALLGMYLFLRAIAASTAGAALGAFAYGFSSFFATRMGHPTFVASAAWVPFIFYGFELAGRRGRAGTLLLACFLAMGYLAGFPQVLVFGVAALVAYALALALDRAIRGPARDGLAFAQASARAIGVAGGLALLVVAVQLVPFLEYLRNSVGLGISFDEMKTLYVSKPLLFLRVLLPGFFGNPVAGTNWLPMVQHGVHPYNLGFLVYCGIGTLMLALGGLAFLRDSEHLRALFAVLVLSLGIGMSGVVLRVFYAAVPLFRYSQIDRVSVVACFALAALGGKSFSLFVASPRRASKRLFLAIAGGVLGLLVAGIILFAARGDSLLTSFGTRSQVAYHYLGAGSERVFQWLDGRTDLWAAYEKGQMIRGLALAAATLALLSVVARAATRSRRLVLAVSALLVALVAADNLTVARSYYVSQPAGAISETDGIRTLKDLVGTKGEWRTLNEEGATWVFPPNVNEQFGIQALRGRATIVPRAYSHLLGAGSQLSPEGLQGMPRSEPDPEEAGQVSTRYLLRSRFDKVFASGIFAAIAKEPVAAAAIGMPNLGGEARVAFCQVPGETLRVDAYIPPGARLDFFVGSSGGDTVTVELTCESPAARVQFRKDLAAPEIGRWYDESLDVSSLGGQYAKLVLTTVGRLQAARPPALGQGGAKASAGGAPVGATTRVGASAGASAPAGAWGGFELVLADCRTRETSRGYSIETDRPGVVSVTVASGATDVPLEITTSSGKVLRWLAFPPYLRFRTIEVDVGGGDGAGFTVTSDSAFTVTASHMVYDVPGGAWGDLVYAGDMYVFENPAALEKACIVPAGAVSALAEARLAGVKHAGSGRPDLRCGRVRIVSYEAEKLEMEVNADQDGVLVVQDAFYPGWTALVDGQRRPIRVSDIGTRLVDVSKGNHKVVMQYRPGTLRWGIVLTSLGLLAGVVYAIQARRRIES